MLQGLPVSPGLAVGRAVIVRFGGLPAFRRAVAPDEFADEERRLRRASRARLGLVLTAVLAAVYAAGTSVLMVQEWHDAPATKDAYSSLFFTIQGAHVAHVAAGVLVNLYLLATIARGRISQYRMNGIWAMALYWHFVNVLAVFVLLTTIAPAL